MIASDENAKQNPNLELSNMILLIENKLKRNENIEEMKKKLIDSIIADSMASLYTHVCEKFSWLIDESSLKTMKDANIVSMTDLEKKIVDATENAGDTEVLEGMFAKARFSSSVGDWPESVSAYDDILKRPKLSTGKKIDATMEKARISLFLLDFKQMKVLITETKKYIDLGGDWDRRNRLKVYEAIYLLSARDLKAASVLFIECVATFTCVEIVTYQQFMIYAVLANIPNLSRTDLKKKLITNPHVISMLREIPKITTVLHSLYNCEYATFFKSLLVMYEDISEDIYLGPHATYLVREYRVLAYSQFLDAYKSVTLSSMAEAFGISVSLLDAELSRFISAGRLNAKIDKVGDVIETSRPDQKNAQYQEVIKKGDSLLNQIQKLVRVVDV